MKIFLGLLLVGVSALADQAPDIGQGKPVVIQDGHRHRRTSRRRFISTSISRLIFLYMLKLRSLQNVSSARMFGSRSSIFIVGSMNSKGFIVSLF